MEDSKKNEIFDLFSELSFGEEQISLSFDQWMDESKYLFSF
jgi:hypothetical protein